MEALKSVPLPVHFAAFYSKWFEIMPAWLATALIAMVPIAELRASIPIAYATHKLPMWQICIWSVIGNMIPIFFILWLLEPVSRFLMEHSKTFDRFFTWLFERTRRKLGNKYEIYEDIALMLFVAIPLPVTGAWTGAVAAFVFGIPYRRAIVFIFLGVLIACGVVTAVTLTGGGLIRIFTSG